MSTDTLFRSSIPTMSLTGNNIIAPVPTTTTNIAIITTNTTTSFTSTAELNSTAVFTPVPIKEDLSNIPPAFFVGAQVKEHKVTFDQPFSIESGSTIGYGNRRLSGVLAEHTEKNEEEAAPEVPAKRIILNASDAERGLFGVKRVKSRNMNSALTAEVINNTSNIAEDINTKDIDALASSKTIRIFGYPENLAHNVISHFMTYGKVEGHKESPGNWMTITYESNTSALAALKSNGVIISKNHMIGVSLEKETPTAPVLHNIVPRDVSDGVFKVLNNQHGLGSGKVGVSASDKNDINGEAFSNNGIISKLKDTFFGW